MLTRVTSKSFGAGTGLDAKFKIPKLSHRMCAAHDLLVLRDESNESN